MANECHINLKVTVPYSPCQNKAEATVRELKRFTRRKIQQTKSPRRLWSCAGKWGAATRTLNILELDGMTPYEHIAGSTPNITLYCMFDWYQPVHFHQSVSGFPHQKRELGRLIGVADNCTDELAYVILPKTGRILIWKSVWAIELHKMNDLAVQADLFELNTAIDNMFGDKTLKLNCKGEVRATDLPNDVDIVDLPPPPPDLLKGTRT